MKQANSDVIRSCEEHATFWGIREECDRAVTKLAEWRPAAIPDSDYALLQSHGGKTVRKYAAYDADSTVAASIAFTRKTFHKTGRRYLLFKYMGSKGTVYFSLKGRTSQILLQKTGATAKSDAQVALKRLTRRFGRSARTIRRTRHHWRNRHTALTVVTVKSRRGWHLYREYVSDPDPKRRKDTSPFSRVRGWSVLSWKMTPA